MDNPCSAKVGTSGGLEPGESSRLHRHNYETLIYILEGTGKSRIGDKEVAWVKGDAIYVPVWAWHQHSNLSDTDRALYLACENAPHLQNLGIALREEAQVTLLCRTCRAFEHLLPPAVISVLSKQH